MSARADMETLREDARVLQSKVEAWEEFAAALLDAGLLPSEWAARVRKILASADDIATLRARLETIGF